MFLVARFFPLFEASEVAMNTVAIIGGVTAIFAASMALVMSDIKRVLAYSTVSQLGFMMLAPRSRRLRRGHIPSVHPRLLQGAPVSGLGQRQPRHGHLRHAIYGRPAKGDALDLRHLCYRRTQLDRYLSPGRVLEQRRDPLPRLEWGGRCESGDVLAGDSCGLHDGLLHIPGHLHDL